MFDGKEAPDLICNARRYVDSTHDYDDGLYILWEFLLLG